MKNKTILFGFTILSLFSTTVSYAAAVIPKLPDTSATSSFTQTINPGVLSVDIVDGTAYTTVASPVVAMGAVTFSFACQTATGSFGTASQSIYVRNPDASDTGWSLGLAAALPTASWTSAGTGMDFNDPTVLVTAGCGDGADADTLKGQMTVNATTGTVVKGQCLVCTTTGVTASASAAFNQATLDSIEIMRGAIASDDIGDWKLTGVTINQKIPAEQPAAADYAIPLTLTVTSI